MSSDLHYACSMQKYFGLYLLMHAQMKMYLHQTCMTETLSKNKMWLSKSVCNRSRMHVTNLGAVMFKIL